MGFDRAFHAAATYASPTDLDGLRRHIDPDWIEQALAATGSATVRRRRLPAEQVIWVVLGIGLFRDRPIEDVVSKVDLALATNAASPGGVGQFLVAAEGQFKMAKDTQPMTRETRAPCGRCVGTRGR
jgi:transposase IS4-like protein